MKIILLFLLGAFVVLVAGCESDLPPEPGKPAISFKTGEVRDESFDRAGTIQPHREVTAP
jgi:hypothetical protein